jgi:hypothetical protein
VALATQPPRPPATPGFTLLRRGKPLLDPFDKLRAVKEGSLALK